MEHKAYKFEINGFNSDLKPILLNALSSGDIERLKEFVNKNIIHCSFPWSAEPLPINWEQELEFGDVHEIGDLAITKYYNPDELQGLSYEYIDLTDRYDEIDKLLLGSPLGIGENNFDPGKMGSYFLSQKEALRTANELKAYKEQVLLSYSEFLLKCVEVDFGVYITF